MKKLITILMLVAIGLVTQVKAQGVTVLGPLTTNGSVDLYPTHVDTFGKGGLMTVGSWAERNLIPTLRRKAGMIVRVKSLTVDSTYTLGLGLANADWYPFSAGGTPITNLNQIATRSYNDLQNKPTIPDISGKADIASPIFSGDVVIDGFGYPSGPYLKLSPIEGSSTGGLTSSITFGSQSDADYTTKLMPNALQAANSNIDLQLPIVGGTLARMEDLSDFPSLYNSNTFSGTNTFQNRIIVDRGFGASSTMNTESQSGGWTGVLNFYNSNGGSSQLRLNPSATSYGQFTLPTADGTLATTSDVSSAISTKANDADVVKLAGNQTIAGVKTFSSPITVATPTEVSHATTKSYVDGELSLKLTGERATNLLNPNNNRFPTTQAMVNVLFEYEKISNKATNLTSPDNTKYPTTLAVSSALSGKANDADVVKLSGNQNINGTKTFSGDLIANSINASAGLTVGGMHYGKIVFKNDDNDKPISIEHTGAESRALGIRPFGSMYLGVIRLPELTAGRAYDFKDESGTVAFMSDIPKMFTYTTSGDGSTTEFTIPHGLAYTPTMVIATGNSKDTLPTTDDTIGAGITANNGLVAKISGSNIIISYVGSTAAIAPPTGTNNLTWTILVK